MERPRLYATASTGNLTMKDIVVNEYLTWEYSTDPDIQYLECPPPTPVMQNLPQWFKDLKAYRNYDIGDRTIRHCMGFRGIAQIGYTIPLPEDVNDCDTYFSRGRIHPEMIHGSKWAAAPGGPWEYISQGKPFVDPEPYTYRFKLLFWPWRAKMPPGWRLLILPYLLDWSDDWNEFSGTVEPNYEIHNGTSVGSALKWTQLIDPNYNYYNIETVVALRRSVNNISKGTLTFSVIPYFDPEMERQQKGGTYVPMVKKTF